MHVIGGNARDMKALSHKKTDKIDSEFIALLALKDMIRPSRIFPKKFPVNEKNPAKKISKKFP